ncbi:Diadenosine tetraphosphate (Ap4A) hydrolase [Actinomyces ruminicola]|uniref:Diadenosine tetraphosphate (Ap4A) hydrolase n=1 Tax=Actinomyces ruminicola TaxID=332524 RepID=A0A1H0FB07_9ACTO|nr:Diadenosine tetraphosphate (Ap4A) hydrolase [Actinomyces ruminicola]
MGAGPTGRGTGAAVITRLFIYAETVSETTSPAQSVFTKIIGGELPGRFVWADDTCVAFATIAPHTDGHVLVVPREPIVSYVDAPDELVAHLAVVAKRIGRTQTRVFDAARAAVMVVGYEIDHLHLHVLPIRSEADVAPAAARHDVTDAELDAAMERLRVGLREDGWGGNVPASLNSPALA